MLTALDFSCEDLGGGGAVGMVPLKGPRENCPAAYAGNVIWAWNAILRTSLRTEERRARAFSIRLSVGILPRREAGSALNVEHVISLGEALEGRHTPTPTRKQSHKHHARAGTPTANSEDGAALGLCTGCLFRDMRHQQGLSRSTPRGIIWTDQRRTDVSDNLTMTALAMYIGT